MHFEKKARLCLLPAFSGLCIFYLIPFVQVVVYSFTENTFSKHFVGIANYVSVLKNPYFRLATCNTLQMIALCVPCYLLLSFVLSLLFWLGKSKTGMMRKFCIYPIILPTLATATSFQSIFSSFDNVLPIYVMFLWKYCGYGIILLSASIQAIPKEYYELAQIDGASMPQLHRFVTLPLCRSSLNFTAILATVFCLRIYRESSLFYYGKYPPNYSYTMQYYMSNHFLKLNYPNLAAAALLNILFMLSIFFFAKSLIRYSFLDLRNIYEKNSKSKHCSAPY